MADSPQLLALRVATPKGIALEAEVESVQVPGSEGEFGVLSAHRPLLASIKPGVLKYRKQGQDRVAAIDQGYAEVGPSRISVLAEGFATSEQVDIEAVKQALADAEQRQKEFEGVHEGAEYEELVRAVGWCHAQLAVAQN